MAGAVPGTTPKAKSRRVSTRSGFMLANLGNENEVFWISFHAKYEFYYCFDFVSSGIDLEGS